jgi:hypothetical protein
MIINGRFNGLEKSLQQTFSMFTGASRVFAANF